MKKKATFSIFPLAIVVGAVGVLVFIARSIDSPTVLTTSTKDLAASTLDIPEESTPLAPYRSITVTTTTPGAEIADAVGLSHVPFVLAFNRLDERHIRRNTKIVIPPTLTDWDALSPFPADLSVARDIPKLLIVSQRIQAIGAYEHGALVRWMVTSTGKEETPTPSRLYFTNWKGKLVKSTLEGDYMLPWAFNLDSMEGIALHQFDLPGYPASHACIRLLEADAMWIYDWAEQWILDESGQKELAKGTPVIVYGEYAYDTAAPWKALLEDPHASDISVEELTDIVEQSKADIAKEAQQRTDIETTHES